MAKKKVTLVYSNDHAESIVCAVYVLSLFAKETLSVINIEDLDEAGINTAIGLLAANQDIICIAAPSDSTFTGGNKSNLEAKKTETTGVLYEWEETTTTEEVSMCGVMWKEFNIGSMPDIINFLSTPDADLEGADQTRKNYYKAGVIIAANKISNGDVVLDESKYKLVADTIDVGLYSNVQRDASTNRQTQPTVNRLAMHDILTLGEGYVRGGDIEDAFDAS